MWQNEPGLGTKLWPTRRLPNAPCEPLEVRLSRATAFDGTSRGPTSDSQVLRMAPAASPTLSAAHQPPDDPAGGRLSVPHQHLVEGDLADLRVHVVLQLVEL